MGTRTHIRKYSVTRGPTALRQYRALTYAAYRLNVMHTHTHTYDKHAGTHTHTHTHTHHTTPHHTTHTLTVVRQKLLPSAAIPDTTILSRFIITAVVELMYLVWLHACHVRGIVGNSGLCCPCVTYFERVTLINSLECQCCFWEREREFANSKT